MQRPRGWRASAILFTVFCSIVFAINLSVLIWAASHQHGPSHSTVTLRTGNNAAECSAIANLNRWGHLLINVLSTILLSGSNYCMQCLSAPTRPDINVAHAEGRWLDIGVPSMHNLRWISRRRLYLWLVLGASSLPLHLFYNSAVFTSTSSNNYAVFSVGDDFLNSTLMSSSNYADVGYLLRSNINTSRLPIPVGNFTALAEQLRGQAHKGKLVNLTTDECIRGYTRSFQSSYRNVLLVTDNPKSGTGVNFNSLDGYFWTTQDHIDNHANNTVSFLYSRFYSDFSCAGSQAFDWACIENGTATGTGSDNACDPVCDDPRTLQATLSNSTWAPLGNNVRYCLAEPSETQCSLQFSMPIAVLVVVLNLVKLTTMAVIVRYAFDQKERPLLTMGDAVSSFLEAPDHASKGMSLISASVFKLHGVNLWHKAAGQKVITYPGEIRQRWAKAVSTRRWFVCLLLYIAGLSTAAGYLGNGLNAMSGTKDLASLWSIGFGSPSGRTMIISDSVLNNQSSLLGSVVLANIPQLILSILYFTYNGLFTCMLLASEWNSYSLQRKGLRISSSHPQGAQRSGYFLQLPFRFSIPLILFSLLFHWLISQSIFVVNINMFDYDGNLVKSAANSIGHLMTCGYSPIAIIFSLVLGGLLVVALLGFGVGMKFKTGMPIAGSCSLAIAAACHTGPSSDEKLTLAQQPLKWGEIEASSGTETMNSCDMSKPLPTIPCTADSSNAPANSGAYSRITPHDIDATTSHSDQGNLGGDLEALLPSTPASPNMQPQLVEMDPDTAVTVVSDEAKPGRCGFSAGPVTMPGKGRLYA